MPKHVIHIFATGMESEGMEWISQVKFGNPVGSVVWQGISPVLHQWKLDQWLDITLHHQPVSHWEGIPALLKSPADSWLDLPRPRCSNVPRDGQEEQCHHQPLSQCCCTHITPPSTCARTCVTQIFRSKIPGETQLLASKSDTPKHHKSRCFLSFGISEWNRLYLWKWWGFSDYRASPSK